MMTYDEMMTKALEMLENDGDLFVEMVDELDSWDGFADGYKVYNMCDLDELFYDCKVSEFLGKLADGFDLNDDYFADTIYGLESIADKEDYYRDNFDCGEVLDNVISNYNHLYISDSEFEELIDAIVNYNEEDGEN